jgi:hypothetical protein
MPASLSIIVAKDGAAATIVGGLQALDLSGAGTGPWSLANVIVDGVSGTLRAAVTASNALKVDGSAVTQPVSIAAAVTVAQATAASLNATVVGTGTFAVQLSGATNNINNIAGTISLPTGASTSANQATEITSLGTIAGAVTSSVMQSNTKQVNGVTTLAGAGAVGTGSQRVAVGQDTTTISGSAPGTAGSASANVLTVQGVASMTPVQVSQATAASLNATVVGTGTFAVQAAATLNAETTKVIGTVRNVGNAGGIFDFAGQNAAAPANSILIGGEFNTTPTTITPGNASPLQLDNAGNLLVNIKAGAGSGGTAIADEAAFTEGTTSLTPIGGVYKTSHTALSTGQAGVVAMTANRSIYTAMNDGVNALTLLAASSGPPATTVVAIPVSLRDANSNGATTAALSAPVTLPTDAAATTITVTPTVTASSTYSAGNEVGGLMTFASAGRTPGTSGVIQDVTITSKTAQTGEFDLYLFDSNPSSSTWADKTGPAINAADVAKVIGIVKLTKNYSGLGTHTVYKPDETTFAPIPFAASSLYGVLVTPGVPSAQFGSTADLTVKIGVI